MPEGITTATVAGTIVDASGVAMTGYVRFSRRTGPEASSSVVVTTGPIDTVLVAGAFSVELLPGPYLFEFAGSKPVPVTVPGTGDYSLADLLGSAATTGVEYLRIWNPDEEQYNTVRVLGVGDERGLVISD